LGYVTFNATTVDIQKLFIARGITGVPVPPSGGGGGGGGVYVPPSTTTPTMPRYNAVNNKVSIFLPSPVNQSIVGSMFMEFYIKLIEDRHSELANTNHLGSTEKVFGINPIKKPYGIMKTPFINSLPDLSQRRKSFQPKTKKAK
ncbi:MAG: hypothetical protein K0R02_1199, partial [Rickettsiaceae bacterium]|nr:hypothetical protein [Rickettsiaceae bacterium]